jgi:integrase
VKVAVSDLQGDKGRDLLLAHATHISRGSRTHDLSCLRRVWRTGLGIPWPDLIDDLPKAQRPRRERAPARPLVAKWVEAARREHDPYLKSWLLTELNGGLRPIDQMGELRVEDLVRDPNGVPVGIVADAERHDFKVRTDIRQYLPPEVGEAMKAWLDEHPSPTEGSFIWPQRARSSMQVTKRVTFRMRWNFAKKHGLPWLTSKAMRHAVRTILNDGLGSDGEAKVLRHYWQGHTPDLGDMDERYGDRPAEEILELQRRRMPGGALGAFPQLGAGPARPEQPVELERIWERAMASELDAAEAGDLVRDLVRTVKKAAAKEAPITP